MLLALQLYIIWVGARIGFFSGSVMTVLEDMQTLRPTIFTTVPRLLYRLYDVTHEKVSKSALKKYILNWAVTQKCKSVDR